MDELENLNKIEKINYFDRNSYEEDLPLEIDQKKQDKYKELEKIFNQICKELTVEVAGVT